MAFEYLAQYETFNSVQEMDQHVEEHMAVHYYELTESEVPSFSSLLLIH
ncbi:hypothetical protein [Lysinibacillus pakistanensis]|uniref:Uncharacterized protein n=1 Tax=Lysinibacillus pakistanensis TaxID=759811 RepID=A0AAX3WRA6_9BACI|nr:hypothetical protein [Lysinibacillus pakistanensis]MDM5229767.1 hypothetical protein [Lysinibacillus pakistanensis]WHY45370.1 hypothetical protein QNH22_18945 [Lysinibacillus pakistanensis]WHY50378.1 hypothetical protein QNH24_18910 [Lysinibacillus pakistanensis]